MLQSNIFLTDSTLSGRLDKLRSNVGQEVGLSEWQSFDQAKVSTYGAITGENLWIHTDPIRAADSRFGSTIVQGSLLMARFGSWIQSCGVWLPEPAVPVNYGYDRVRIVGALPVGAWVRARVVLRRFSETKGSVRMDLMIELQRPEVEKPVISAEWIVVFLLPD